MRPPPHTTSRLSSLEGHKREGGGERGGMSKLKGREEREGKKGGRGFAVAMCALGTSQPIHSISSLSAAVWSANK